MQLMQCEFQFNNDDDYYYYVDDGVGELPNLHGKKKERKGEWELSNLKKMEMERMRMKG